MSDKKVRTSELFDCNTPFLTELFNECEYPWQIVAYIKDYILKIIDRGIEGYELLNGNILVGKNVKISPNAEINGPAIIGSNTEIRIGAFIRGNVIIGENCIVGNSCEVKNSILLNNVQIPHYNYVGDSVLGNKSHLGAGSVCSNLKNDNKPVVVHGDEDHSTGMRKLGAILADNVNVGCGCVLNPGTVIGKNTAVYPMVSVRGVIPADKIVKSTECISEKRG